MFSVSRPRLSDEFVYRVHHAVAIALDGVLVSSNFSSDDVLAVSQHAPPIPTPPKLEENSGQPIVLAC
nr:hypothetical protein Iba_chr03aCG6370 [Ipomoea batatas]